MAVRVGTCSWTEKTLLQSGEFYPQGVRSPEGRLRYYASVFDVVEVDSSYYAIPPEKNVRLWAERTPPDFTFHMKAYAPLTGHATELASLPQEVRDLLPAESLSKNRVDLRGDALKAAFTAFRQALLPLEQQGKLGIVVFQYPPFLTSKTENLDYILFCRDMMGGAKLGIEFRHGSWLTEEKRQGIFSFFEKNGLAYITADEPQYGSLATIPFVPEATSDIAYFRLHGRNRQNWLRKGIETSERYNYLYSRDELRSFVPSIRSLSRKAKAVHVLFNNCHGGFAVRNALEMRGILKEQGIA